MAGDETNDRPLLILKHQGFRCSKPDFSRLPFKFAELDHRWMVFCGESTKKIFSCSKPLFRKSKVPVLLGIYTTPWSWWWLYIIYIYVWLMMVFIYNILPILLPNCWKKGVLYCGLCWAALDTGRSLTGAGCFFLPGTSHGRHVVTIATRMMGTCMLLLGERSVL